MMLNMLQRLFQFIFKPLVNRAKLGEGGIVVFNITYSVFATHNIKYVLAVFGISLFALCALYGYNDYIDRFIDSHNKKKEQNFVADIVAHHRFYLAVNLVLSILLIVFAWFLIGSYQATAMLLLLAVNAAYS